MPRCKICRCTYDRACANSCSWASAAQSKALETSPLCSNCAEILERLIAYSSVAYEFRTGAIMNAVRRIQARPFGVLEVSRSVARSQRAARL